MATSFTIFAIVLAIVFVFIGGMVFFFTRKAQ